ncbi:hypothetical protein [Mycobacterium sp. 155]|uniref:hypothetical protein n=1 Tax=Mycobacterium sp. 155 TaxID=1157943 RepID=UPI0003700533|nr:hypothetical protein [Mycobacterium sp. 155]
MNRSLALAVAAIGTAAAVGAGACARANPEPTQPGPSETAAPRAGSGCDDNLDSALTELPHPAAETGTAKNLLQCTGGAWQGYLDPYPASDRWLTTGPELVLHGQGRRNPEVRAGTWTATPQTDETSCRAEVVDVVAAGETSPPETHAADPGQPLTIEFSDHLFTATLSGYCLWQRG